jgi:hypothetical protein
MKKDTTSTISESALILIAFSDLSDNLKAVIINNG